MRSITTFFKFLINCTIIFLSLFFNSLDLKSQSMRGIKYQSVVRNESGQLILNQNISIYLEILRNSDNGQIVYSEKHFVQSNDFGLIKFNIGNGFFQVGDFHGIEWNLGPYFLKIEIDINGGQNYTIISNQQLLSVPYALYSFSAGNSAPGPQGLQGPSGSPGINGSNGLNGLTAYEIWLNAGNLGSESDFLNSLQGIDGDTASDNQQLSVSSIGDTLYIENGGFVIIPGISGANSFSGETGIVEHTCGADNIHNAQKTYSTIMDLDGNSYRTIIIGNKEWMAENLKTTKYQNGDLIPSISVNIEWQNSSNTLQGGWCFYNNNPQNDCPYGKLYNWYAVSDPRGICPVGWHIPSDIEWTQLIDTLGGLSIAGGKMKSVGTQFWNAPNIGATNESGFSGLPARYRNIDGTFGNVSFYGCLWWSSTEITNTDVWARNIYNSGIDVNRLSFYKSYGISVRCVRD